MQFAGEGDGGATQMGRSTAHTIPTTKQSASGYDELDGSLIRLNLPVRDDDFEAWGP